MLKCIMSCIRNIIPKHNKSRISQRDLKEFMRVEGVTWVDIFPPTPTKPTTKYK